MLFWHELALAIGGCTVRELRVRMTAQEAEDWRRFFMIRGPAGDKRIDAHFALLRWMIAAGLGSQSTLDDHKLKYDYRQHFPKDIETAIADAIENIDHDIEAFVGKFKKRK